MKVNTIKVEPTFSITEISYHEASLLRDIFKYLTISPATMTDIFPCMSKDHKTAFSKTLKELQDDLSDATRSVL